jgi:parallel beta-helix repeat protein
LIPVEVKASNGYPVHNLNTGLNYTTIQEAIDAPETLNGNTIFVESGIYYEHIIVSKTVSIVGENVETTIIDGNSTGHVIHVISDNVSISGFTVQNSGNIHTPDLDAGICLNGTTGCTISENRAINNGFCGISLLHSNRNTITDNNLSSAGWGGVHLMSSSYNIISGNIITDKYGGINGHVSSNYNNITENTISNCTYGEFYHASDYNNICRNNISTIAVEGIWLQDDVDYNIVAENNLINNTVAIRVQGPNNNNTLSRNIITGAEYGIKVENYALYTRIADNIIENNLAGNDLWSAGIRLDYAMSTQIHSNAIRYNNYGVLLYSSSSSVSVYGNNITNNEYGLRVASGGSSFLAATGNFVANNHHYGIGVTGFGSFSNYAAISQNTIINNSMGISLGQYSNYNIILQNSISENSYGLYIEYSTQNKVLGNSILNNDQQVYVDADSVNTWDYGYPSGGNYWSNYTGPDTDCDGIGDTPQIINANNTDRYPLMGMFSDFIAASEQHVQTICNSTISNFQFNGTAIMFNVTGVEGTTGFCRIFVPTSLMNATYRVFVNGTEVVSNLLPCSNSTHSYLYFNYTHSTEEVIVIPEFPSFLALPLLMIAALLPLTVCKRKRKSLVTRG